MRLGILVVLLVSVLGCALAQTAVGACKHPYPCGGEWPAGLQGPFELRSVEEVRVEVPRDYEHPGDGTISIQGWIALPAVPAGVKVPVAMSSHPYRGNVRTDGSGVTPGDPAYFGDTPPVVAMLDSLGLKPKEFIRRGYAMALFSVRGSGASGGCFEFTGPNEQRDQATIVEWLARQPWSNGRVGMQGLSYPGTTPFEAGIHTPKALKSILAGGIHSDLYTSFATPQGGWTYWSDLTGAEFNVLFGIAPPILGEPQAAAGRPLDQRLCDDAVELTTSNHLNEDRHGALWDARRMIDHFDRVTAAVLLFHGALDGMVTASYHGTQDDWAWQALTQAPKRQILGQWAHKYPGACDSDMCTDGRFPAAWHQRDWQGTVFEWLDYWLKGLGDEPERLGKVDYQDSSGTWQSSTEWPPKKARDEVLYLADDALAVKPGGATRGFLAATDPANTWEGLAILNQDRGATSYPANPSPALCPRATDAAQRSGLLYTSPAATQTTLIAGNPFAYLKLESNLPGGIAHAYLVDLAPDFACDATGTPTGLMYLTMGSADLRFHKGNFVGRDFPTGTVTGVRHDFEGIVHRLPPGHRLGLVVQGPLMTFGQPYFPLINVHSQATPDSSQLVLPIVEGGFGGGEPKIAYPPRPFLRPPAASEVASLPSTRRCASRRHFRIRLRHPGGARIRAAAVYVNGRRVATRSGRRTTARIDLRGLPRGRFTVRIRVALVDGRVVRETRVYRTCRARAVRSCEGSRGSAAAPAGCQDGS